MTDRRRRAASSDSSSREEREDNPFAPPPEGQPDQPWQPRRRGSGEDDQGNGNGDGSGNGSGSGNERDRPSSWGSQWSSKQPGRQSGGFGGIGGGNGNGGQGNGGGEGPGGPGGPGSGGPRGMRWDPTDQLQRHARYALHAGIWGLFFALLGVPYVALLLGALSLYWGIHALRGKKGGSGGSGTSRRRGQVRATAEDVAGTSRTDEDKESDTAGDTPAQGKIKLSVTPEQAAKAQRTAAISGLVTASLTLAMVAATFTFQMVYSDYYTCKEDALTQSSRDECKQHLPEQIRPILENRP
ncbi:hypothetical protein [Streptomyces albiaxialis]